jgi:hypothetical protein
MRFFVQVCLEGEPYRDQAKEMKHRAAIKEKYGDDVFTNAVSVDFGPRKIAVSNGKISYERLIVRDHLQKLVLESKALQRQMSRSLRLNNPLGFKEGKLKKGVRLEKTKSYLKLSANRKDMERRIAAHRKCIHGHLSQEIMQLGPVIKLENISYKALQKRYGRSVGESAPSSLKASLFRTAEKLGGRGELINTYQTRLSQTCLCGEIKKKRLSERRHNCNSCGLKVPRDILSAFLGCFTLNEVRKKGRKEIINSSLDLASARLAANGNQTFSVFGGPRSENHHAAPSAANFKDQGLCQGRGEMAVAFPQKQTFEGRPPLEKLKRSPRRSTQESLNP